MTVDVMEIRMPGTPMKGSRGRPQRANEIVILLE
jgi:hypothetical protein